jgi:glucose-1-phosphate adenylyltransferase
MASKVLAMILAGGRVGELSVLTLRRPKSAMPFGGMYRVIDCALTNLIESGIDNIGILSQYRPLSLMSHVGSGAPWDLIGLRRGVRFLPPHTGVKDSDWYKGTSDALFQNLNYIRNFNPDRVLIVSGDHIYRMNYDPLFELHQQKGAEMTMAVTQVDSNYASRFGLVRLAKDGKVEEYQEKPKNPISRLASMTVYLFETEVLLRELEKNAVTGKTFQIYDEILPPMVKRNTVFAHVFKGYWSYSRTIHGYYLTNMDCAGEEPLIELSKWKLRTRLEGCRIGDPPPLLSGSSSRLIGSIVSPGCEVYGSVFQSVLSPNVVIEEGATIKNSVLLDGVRIKAGASVRYCVIDKDSVVGENCRIGVQNGETPIPNETLGDLLSTGLTIIGKNAQIPSHTVMGGNVLVYPEACESMFSARTISGGSTIGSIV